MPIGRACAEHTIKFADGIAPRIRNASIPPDVFVGQMVETTDGMLGDYYMGDLFYVS